MRVEVSEERARVEVGEDDLEDEIVVAPPPTVDTTTSPTELVVVMTWPSVSDDDASSELDDAGAEVVSGVLEDVRLSGVDAEDDSVSGAVEDSES